MKLNWLWFDTCRIYIVDLHYRHHIISWAGAWLRVGRLEEPQLRSAAGDHHHHHYEDEDGEDNNDNCHHHQTTCGLCLDQCQLHLTSCSV